MLEALPNAEAVLEVISNDGAKRYVRVTQTPFLIGRGAETGNHLQLNDRRISRNCAAIVSEANKFYIEDRGQRRGLFVNGEKAESRELQDGDMITFGLEDSYEIIYRSSDSAAAESQAGNRRRAADDVRRANQPFQSGHGRSERLFRESVVHHDRTPKYPVGRGAKSR